MNRRDFFTKSALMGGASVGLSNLVSHSAFAGTRELNEGRPLPIPAVIEPGTGAKGQLDAIRGTTEFIAGIQTQTQGFNQSYLGPVIRFKRGQSATMSVSNKTDALITAHWHGMHVEGAVDGGPQTAFAPGQSRSPELEIDQPASTLWYHSHVHGKTADQVYAGLAGMIIVDDPDAPDSGLPSAYGVDDIPIIVQDRAFDESGQLLYIKRGPSLMHGFRAGEILVNGAVRPTASVPKGMVRLRLLNASNARIYNFTFDDDRVFHQVGTDGGLLPKPLPKTSLMLAPAERAEIIVDFADEKSVRLLSTPDANDPMGGGMMSRMMGGNVKSPEAVLDDGRFEVMGFTVDSSRSANLTQLPSTLAGSPSRPDWGEPQVHREFSLDMHVGGGGMMSRMMGRNGGMGIMGINGQSMDMAVINAEARLGETELWRITSSEMAHPFHIHGTSFQVLSHNDMPMAYEDVGLKDVFLVDGEAELLVKHVRKADSKTPFMYHCHILEHEDAGMMGQFTVS
ncbi:MAG: multicopper oxidase domain-containing protein [Granulosicoccaceae bacterium]